MLPDAESTLIRDPQTHVNLEDQKAVDTVLAGELNKLSVQEREMVYEEIHGVERITPETPDFVDSRLHAMDVELRRIPLKPAYDLATTMSREYVSSRKLRLMFLRADNFDATKAAKRMVKFFESKLWIFGKNSLARPILLSDFDDDDRVALASGCYRILPSRDRSGRVVLVDLQNMVPKTWKRSISLVRTVTYILMSALEDEETQRRGLVGVLYHMGKGMEIPDSDMREGFVAMPHIPMKITGLHMCHGNPWVNAYARTMLGMAGPVFRARARLHTGSHTELQYSLTTFGLPMDVFPVSTEGEVDTTGIRKWIAKRQLKEQSFLNDAIQNDDPVDIPGICDILVGKGKPFQRHTGNVRLRAMVESYLDEYISVPIGEKHLVAKKVLNIVRQHSGRFLKKEKHDWWVEVSNADALEKVSKLFLTTRAVSKGTRHGSSVKKVVRQGDVEKRARIGFCTDRQSQPTPGMVAVDTTM